VDLHQIGTSCQTRLFYLISVIAPILWSTQARKDINGCVFSARNFQTTHWMTKTELLFSFIKQILKWRLLQIGQWNYRSLLLYFTDANS
jgi:hypothetical protein